MMEAITPGSVCVSWRERIRELLPNIDEATLNKLVVFLNDNDITVDVEHVLTVDLLTPIVGHLKATVLVAKIKKNLQPKLGEPTEKQMEFLLRAIELQLENKKIELKAEKQRLEERKFEHNRNDSTYAKRVVGGALSGGGAVGLVACAVAAPIALPAILGACAVGGAVSVLKA